MSYSQLASAIIRENQPKKIEKKSLTSILWQKILHKIDEKSFEELLIIFSKLLLIIFIFSFLLFPEFIKKFCTFLFFWNDKVIIKTVLIGFLIFNFQKIISTLIFIFGKIKKHEQISEKHIGMINGIPTMGLIDHLLIEKSFKRADIEDKFKIPRRKYENLAKALERLGIIFKDKNQNNSFMFNNEFDEQDLINIFRGKSDANSLEHFAQIIENELILSPISN